MANNRITYATAQLAIKDNRTDATSIIMGTVLDATLASGVGLADGEIAFNEVINTEWPAAGMFRVKNGTNGIEYIRYGVTLDANTVGDITRGTGGTTPTVLASGELAQFAGWEVPLFNIRLRFFNQHLFHKLLHSNEL